MLRLPRLVRAATALAALALSTALACSSSPPPSTPKSRAEAGAPIFRRYCASCHGLSAQGDGTVAASLRKPPADLTRIVALRGSFDTAAVAAFIDGRERVAAHGPADMPVWGRRFDDRLEGGAADETKLAPGDIYLVVEYLRSIQRTE